MTSSNRSRRVARDAFEAWVKDKKSVVSISDACGLVWNCASQIDRSTYRRLCVRLWEDVQMPPMKRSYAACARAILKAVKESTVMVA